ncbi:hypothetical protein ABZX30_17995 [Streptomyces sp. NPDC004542]|uniref:hypothetical protein n=1 Tax=Streptomyces sp. NPDC004542 TaxID=3154281 RepID=UPI00339FD396
MTNPEWFPLVTAAATALGAAVAAVIGRLSSRTALQIGQLSSLTAFESSYTKDRLDAVIRFLDSVETVLADPRPDTRAKVKSEFLRVRIVLHPGGPPVDVARQIVTRLDHLMGSDALRPSDEEKMLEKLLKHVRDEQGAIEEHGADDPPQLKWVLDEVIKLRAEDDQAVREGKAARDREQQLEEIEHDLQGQLTPDWLNVRVALGSAEERKQRRQREKRHREACVAVAGGRERFVTATEEWLAERPALLGRRDSGYLPDDQVT